MLKRDLIRVLIVIFLAAHIPVTPSTGEAQMIEPQDGITVFFVEPSVLRTAELRTRFTDPVHVRKTVLVFSSNERLGVGALVVTEFDGWEWSSNTEEAAEKLGRDGQQQISSANPTRFNRLAAVISRVARYVEHYQETSQARKNSHRPLRIDFVLLLMNPLHTIQDELIGEPFCRNPNSDKRFSRALVNATKAFDGLFEAPRENRGALKVRFRLGLVESDTGHWKNTDIYNLLRGFGLESQKSRGIEIVLFNTTCGAAGANPDSAVTPPRGGESRLEGPIDDIALDCSGGGGPSTPARHGQQGRKIPITVPECTAPLSAIDLTTGKKKELGYSVQPLPLPASDPQAGAVPIPVPPPAGTPPPAPGSTLIAVPPSLQVPAPKSAPGPQLSTASPPRTSTALLARPGISMRIASAGPTQPSGSRATVSARAQTMQDGRVLLVHKPPGTGTEPTADEVRRAKDKVFIGANALLQPGVHRLFLVIEPARDACDSGRPFRVDVELEGNAFEPDTARQLTLTEVLRSCDMITLLVARFSGN